MQTIRIPAPIREKWQRWTGLLVAATGASVARLGLMDNGEFELVAADGEEGAGHVGDRRTLAGSGACCESVVGSGDRLSVHDPEADLTWHILNPEWSSNPDMGRGLVCYLGLPLTLPDGTTCGCVSLLRRERTPFGTRAESLLAEFRAVAELDLERLAEGAEVRTLLQGVAEGVLVADNTPAVRRVNQRFLDLWQLSSGQLYDAGYKSALRAMAAKTTDPEAVEQYLRSAQDQGETAIHLADGRILRAASRAVGDESGNVWGRMWLFSDASVDAELGAVTQMDAATGLATRAHFIEVGHQEVNRAKRYGKQLSLIIVHLEGLDRVVDEQGREAGDSVLAAIAQSGRQVVRNLDVFARLNEDTVAVLLPETGQEGAQAMAGRLAGLVGEVDRGPLGVRTGLATYTRELSTFDSLLSLAEASLGLKDR